MRKSRRRAGLSADGTLLRNRREAAQTDGLLLSRLDVLVAARAEHDSRLIRVVYPLAVFHEIFRHMDYSMNVNALPRLPARPVRPMRCT